MATEPTNWSAYPSGGLSTLLSAYQSGQDRKRKQAQDVADRKQKAAEWEATSGKGLKRSTFDDYGNPTGLETNEENRQRDVDRFDAPEDSPQHAAIQTPPPAPAPAPAPTPEPSNTPSGRPIGATQADLAGGNSASGSPFAPPAHPSAGPGKAELASGDPTPLIRDPKAALADQLVPRPGMQKPGEQSFTAQPPVKGPGGEKVVMPQGATSMTYDPNDPKVTQNGQTFVPARQTNVPASGDVSIPPSPEAAALAAPPPAQPQPQPPVARHQSPLSDYALGRTVDMHTMLPRNGVGFVDASGLSPEVQAMLGAVNGKVRSDVLRTYLGDESRKDVANITAGANRPDPLASNIIESMQKDGLPLGTAISMYTRNNGGVGPSKGTMAAMKTAAGLGNQDRNFGLNTDKFGQTKDDKSASIVSDFTKKALADTKLDLEAINTSDTVDRMLQRKDTNGLRKLLPIMIERGFVPQRLTNQMVSADTGLSGFGDKLDQWVTGMEDGSITPENINFFRSLVHDAKEEHSAQYAQKIQRWKRAGVGALMAHGMDADEAGDYMDRELAAEVQTGRMHRGGGNAGGAGGEGVAAPTAPKSKFAPPTKPELSLRKEMMMATQALRQAKTPEDQAKIKGAFQKRTGVPWAAPGNDK